MLPVTHGDRFTRLHVLLYTLILIAVSLLPFTSQHERVWSIWLPRLLLGGCVPLATRCRIYVDYSDALAQQTFRYSIVYLSLLFAALLVDHYWRILRLTHLRRLPATSRAAALVSCACLRAEPPAIRSPARQLPSTDITGADFGKDFQLTDYNGQPRKLADFRGKVVVVFFGYTHCPDVCPTTLSRAGLRAEEAGRRRRTRCRCCSSPWTRSATRPRSSSNTSPLSIPAFLGLRGTPEQTAQSRRSSRCIIQKNPGADADNYTVDHSSGTYRLRPAGPAALCT